MPGGEKMENIYVFHEKYHVLHEGDKYGWVQI